jgi:16S rRNA processing protein RimM
MRLVPVGRIVACHGIGGFVRMVCFNVPPSPQVAQARAFHLERPGVGRAAAVSRPVAAIRPRRRDLLVKFVDMETRTAAESVVGMLASLPEEVLPAPGPGEFYYYEMVGFRVRTTAGVELGTIVETIDTGSNDVWVVRANEREILIPVIADVVRRIDRATGTVTIEPLDGLLDP